MRTIISFLFSLSLLISTEYYVKSKLTEKGEYRASLYLINEHTTKVDISSSVDKNHFVSHSYISTPGLQTTAVFKSNGVFIAKKFDTYTIRYNMTQLDRPKITSTENANLYINMIGRLGHVIEEDIKMIYHSGNVTIFDMNRNNSVILYLRKH